MTEEEPSPIIGLAFSAYSDYQQGDNIFYMIKKEIHTRIFFYSHTPDIERHTHLTYVIERRGTIELDIVPGASILGI